MLSSEVYQSKFSSTNISDHHENFLAICDRIQQLEQMRIVERLARPLSIQQKKALMDEVNSSLKTIQDLMDEIEKMSSIFKGQESATVKNQTVTAHSWKNGVRRAQAKISNFYTERMQYFDVVNRWMCLELRLLRLEEKDWAKSCISRMGPFCICG